MKETGPEFPEFDRIIDEVLSGKRALAFPPGTAAMVTIMMLHILSLGVWLGPTFFGFAALLERQTGAWPLMLPVGIVTIVVSTMVPALLIVRGSDTGLLRLQQTTIAWACVVVLTGALVCIGWIGAPLWLYLIALIGLLIAFRLERGLSCMMYVTFRRRLRVRTQERNVRAKEFLAGRGK